MTNKDNIDCSNKEEVVILLERVKSLSRDIRSLNDKIASMQDCSKDIDCIKKDTTVIREHVSQGKILTWLDKHPKARYTIYISILLYVVVSMGVNIQDIVDIIVKILTI